MAVYPTIYCFYCGVASVSLLAGPYLFVDGFSDEERIPGLDSQLPGKGLPQRNGPVPVSFVLYFLSSVLYSSPLSLQRLFEVGTVLLGFQLGCHPKSLLSLQRTDIGIFPTSIQILVKKYEGSGAQMVNRMDLNICLNPKDDLLANPMNTLLSPCAVGTDWLFPSVIKKPGPPTSPLSVSSINAFVKMQLFATPFHPSLGMKLIAAGRSEAVV